MSTIEDIRQNVTLEENAISNVHTSDFPRCYPGYNDSWNIDKFKINLKIEVQECDEEKMIFDMIGIDAAIANAFRRILLAEVPTMAFEKAFIENNTSLIQDEVLAHRLGLIPIKADPRMFEFRAADDSKGTPDNTLEFQLKVKCTRNPKAPKDATEPDLMYLHRKVYTKDLQWIPLGNQKDLFDVKPVHDDILIAKMKPGQEIDITLEAVKGLGKDHAKFSPVAPATYRLLPRIDLLKPITGKLAHELKSCFSPGVIEIFQNSKGDDEARVINAREDTGSREVFRHPVLKDAVKLSKIRNHFIFLVESTGILHPKVLFPEAVKILKNKYQTRLLEMDKLEIELVEDGSSDTALTYIFHGEDHTAGNPLRYIILKNPQVEFCGYSIPHPAEEKLNLRIQTTGSISPDKVLQKAFQDLISICDHVLEAFGKGVEKFEAEHS